MKVLFLTHALRRSADSAAASLELRLAVALRGEGIEVVIVAPGPNAGRHHEEIDGVAVERFHVPQRQLALSGGDGRGDPRSAAWRPRLTTLRFLGAEFSGAVRARRELEPDVVHAHWWFPGGLVGTWISALGNLPLVTSLHRTDLSAARAGSFARPLFRHVVRNSAVVTADSHGLARKAHAVIAAVEPVIAPMPAATDLFTPGGERAADRLLAVGRLDARGGIEQVLQALVLIQAPVTLDVVGEGEDGPKLQDLARSLGIGDRVRWHGQLEERALVPLFQRATALVLPALNEWLPLTAVHAMLCRTPVVAFDFGGITDLVQHERTGILVPRADSVALCRALDSLLGRPDAGAALGEAGRMYALATFAPESVARRYAGIYRQALASTPA